MTAPAASWQLDRLSTSAREAAEIASLGAGLSLSSWLNRLIGDTCSAEGVAPPSEAPKILEFTREVRERAPASPPRLAPVSLAQVPPTVPQAIPASVPGLQPVPAPIAPAFRPAVLAPLPAAPPAPSQPVISQPLTPPPMTPVAAQAIANITSLAASRVPIAPPPATVQAAAVQPAAPAASAPTMAPAPVMAPPAAPAAAQPQHPAGVAMLPVTAIVAANLGTRRGEDIPEPLLADIATRGVRQPITVRRSASHPDQYEVICGHRRWRAAQRVGLGQVPAIVVAQDDAAAILSSLAENLLQNNLSVLDESQAYLRLLTQCAVDASAVTAAIGRDRKHVVQSMRLLGLPPLVRHLVGSGMLSREHATLLLDAPHPEALADAILAENLSVEATRQRMAGAANAETK